MPFLALDAEVLRQTAEVYLASKSQVETARVLNISRTTLQHRLDEAKRRNIIQDAPSKAPHRIYIDIEDGAAIVGGDAHYWPGIISTAHRAFVKACGDLTNVKLVCMNGDVFDGASISRHPPIGWESRPTVIQEIEACQDRLGEIVSATSKQSGKPRRTWNLGNHDARFETRLATVAPEYARVNGVHLRDHFPEWETAWSTRINDKVVIKHRQSGGQGAARSNAVKAGCTIVTNHLHNPQVVRISNYNGHHYGVDTGTLAVAQGPDGVGPQFMDYVEDAPVDWMSAFAVLTFRKGKLLRPELAEVIDEEAGEVSFRGRVWSV